MQCREFKIVLQSLTRQLRFALCTRVHVHYFWLKLCTPGEWCYIHYRLHDGCEGWNLLYSQNCIMWASLMTLCYLISHYPEASQPQMWQEIKVIQQLLIWLRSKATPIDVHASNYMHTSSCTCLTCALYIRLCSTQCIFSSTYLLFSR